MCGLDSCVMETKVLGRWPDYLRETTYREQTARDAREGKAQILASEACWRMAEHLGVFRKMASNTSESRGGFSLITGVIGLMQPRVHSIVSVSGCELNKVARPLMHDGAVDGACATSVRRVREKVA